MMKKKKKTKEKQELLIFGWEVWRGGRGAVTLCDQSGVEEERQVWQLSLIAIHYLQSSVTSLGVYMM